MGQRLERHPAEMKIRFLGGPWIDQCWLAARYPGIERDILNCSEDTVRDAASAIALEWEMHLGESMAD